MTAHDDLIAVEPDLLVDAATRAARYVASIPDRRVSPSPAAVTALGALGGPLPELPTDPLEVLAMLDDIGSPATVASTGGRYFGFVTGGTSPPALAAAWLTAAWDQNAALPVMSPVAASVHDVVRGWLVDLLGLPDGTAAAFVTGATVANATALAAARDKVLLDVGWDAPNDGLFGAPPVTVVVGEQVHTTVGKALAVLGLGRERVVRVPADDQGRLRADQLPDLNGPLVVCAQAGEVNTGAFDPFPEIIDWARSRGAWVHVDGAFGLWALADPQRFPVAGLVEADSWATDAHKWLNVTYDSGLCFVRHAADLRRTFAAAAGYLPPDEGFEAMHHTPQSSQRARAVEVWAVLRTLGRAGVIDLVRRNCDQARRFAQRLAGAGLEVRNDVVLNQVLVSAEDDRATAGLIAAVQHDGTCWCGPTVWHGRLAMRISVSSWRTTDADIDASADVVVSLAARAATDRAGGADGDG
jgi:glutamate/tyrosine decarboxylase-like PLP-dependent enzyme